MSYFKLMGLISCCCMIFLSALNGLTIEEEQSLQKVINLYVKAWNQQQGRGFSNDFSEEADFVNLFGEHFSGKADIEKRHIEILQTFLKGSVLEITHTHFREVYPGLVIAHVYWQLFLEKMSVNDPWKGLFTQVFIYSNNKWEITASQNTLIKA